MTEGDAIATPKKRRADGQMSGLAGEFFVAAELLKRDIQTSVTLGNAKAVDLLAYREDTGQQFVVQVKSLRTNNYFLIKRRDTIDPSHVYVFVLLNKPGVPVRYFIVPGSELVNHPEKFGKWIDDPKMPGVSPRDLAEFEDNWAVFGCPA
jgi:hypothetical protein